MGFISKVPLATLIPLIATINIKAFIEVAISSLIVEVLLRRPEVKQALSTFVDS
jgi:hypothetical protein